MHSNFPFCLTQIRQLDLVLKSKMLFHAFLFFFTSHIANNKWLKQPKQRAINGQNSEFPIPSAEWNFSGPKSEKNAPNIT